MKPFLPLCCTVLLLLPALARATDEGTPRHGRHGAASTPLLRRPFFSRLVNPFGWGHKAAQPGEAVGEKRTGFRNLALLIKLEPEPLKLAETRQLRVSVRLENRSKKLVQLDFPTTQRIEVVVRNTAGKLIEQWSEDRAFTDTPGFLSVNPGERLEYTATVSTRDLVADEPYIVEAFFPKYEQLRVQRRLVPVK